MTRFTPKIPPGLPKGKVWVQCLRCQEKAALYRNKADRFMAYHLTGRCQEPKGMYA